jgi:hypothetical protein
MDKQSRMNWIFAASAAVIMAIAMIVGDERDHLTKQPDGSYK